MEKVLFFRKVLYIFLLFNTLTLLPAAQDLFGYYGLIGTRGWNTNVPLQRQGTYALLNVLSHPANSIYSWLYMVFISGQIFFLITGIWNKWGRLSAVMVFFFTINLFMKGYLAFTGGEVLIGFILFYLMFIHPSKSGGVWDDLQNIINNVFYWIILLQICLLYFFSTAYKLYDPDWISGKAMMYISQLDEFETALSGIFHKNLLLSKIGTYGTLIYQILFPILVWFKRIKVPFLIVGVFFHLLIAFGMGIFTFGIAMIITYILFLDESHLNWLKQKFTIKKRGGQVVTEANNA